MTNRAFYQAVTALSEAGAETRSLEQYLRCLWGLSGAFREEREISAEAFLKMLGAAYTEGVPAFQEAWREIRYDKEAKDFARWENRILLQIVDLRQMEDAGALKDPMASFGIHSPRGGRWYNFSVDGFLECATVGSFGGWEEGDETGREYVPGEVAVMNEKGEIVGKDPREIEHPEVEIEMLEWLDLVIFLGNGQTYE